MNNDPATDVSTATSLRWPLLVLAVGILIAVAPFVSGLVGALILFALTRRLHYRLATVIRPRVSAVVVAVGTLTVVLVPGAWLVTTIVNEAKDSLHGLNAEDVNRWLASTPFGGSDMTKDIDAILTSALGWLSGRAVRVVGGVATGILNVVLALFGLYYLLLNAPALWTRVKRLIGLPESVADLLAVRFGAITDALLLGTMLTCALQGTIVGIAFALVGLHPAVLWGFVTACAAVLPILGSGFVWLPGIVVLLFTHRFGAAALLAFLGGGIASNVDNVVRLIVYRRVSGIHPMVTLIGVFAGVRMFGLMGAFIGPLVLSCFVELLSVYDEARLGRWSGAPTAAESQPS
ncbi:MAG TPA: AI-2E family transporter [Gemmatimonadaceae bacterium]|jgi:predicted PurR-regulated permease PerM|nr:AI-2E family transporter [Gemmatimonadaceae bacterium]